MKTRFLGYIASAIVFASVVTCSGSEPTAPTQRGVPSDSANLLGLSGPRLLRCPSDSTRRVSKLIGVLGGRLRIAGTTVVIPAGALLAPVRIRLTVPASQYMEIDVSVRGTTTFLFEQPIVMTIDYSRCTSPKALLPLTAWHIDTETKALLEPMVSLDNKLLRTVTFTTIHLSGYALAN